jgi:hypothetical protein
MNNDEVSDLKDKWKALTLKLSEQFGEEPDLQSVIFLIGVQELGRGYQKFSKEEKQDLMHIATCALLSQFGYYALEGVDAEGWPHWVPVSKLPPLKLGHQEQLLTQAVIEYFEKSGFSV